MEIIELTAIRKKRRLPIAETYLIPRQIKENGLEEGQLRFLLSR